VVVEDIVISGLRRMDHEGQPPLTEAGTESLRDGGADRLLKEFQIRLAEVMLKRENRCRWLQLLSSLVQLTEMGIELPVKILQKLSGPSPPNFLHVRSHLPQEVRGPTCLIVKTSESRSLDRLWLGAPRRMLGKLSIGGKSLRSPRSPTSLLTFAILGDPPGCRAVGPLYEGGSLRAAKLQPRN